MCAPPASRARPASAARARSPPRDRESGARVSPTAGGAPPVPGRAAARVPTARSTTRRAAAARRPPVYAPHAAYRPPVPAGIYDAPAPPTKIRRFMALPYLGTHSYQTAANAAYFPGLRIGGLVGGRVSEMLSLNWELTFDISNIDGAARRRLRRPSSRSTSPSAPSYTSPPDRWRSCSGPSWVFSGSAPTFGARDDVHQATRTRAPASWGESRRERSCPVSKTVSLGVLLSGELRRMEHDCTVATGEIALCDLARGSSASIIGLTAAAIFR